MQQFYPTLFSTQSTLCRLSPRAAKRCNRDPGGSVRITFNRRKRKPSRDQPGYVPTIVFADEEGHFDLVGEPAAVGPRHRLTLDQAAREIADVIENDEQNVLIVARTGSPLLFQPRLTEAVCLTERRCAVGVRILATGGAQEDKVLRRSHELLRQWQASAGGGQLDVSVHTDDSFPCTIVIIGTDTLLVSAPPGTGFQECWRGDPAYRAFTSMIPNQVQASR